MVLEKTLESPLDCKEIQPVHPEGYQPWIFIRRTDAEAANPMLWPPAVKNWLTEKDPERGWDGWMVSLSQWTWVWVNSASWWWTGRPGVLQSWDHKHNWVTELNWTWPSNYSSKISPKHTSIFMKRLFSGILLEQRPNSLSKTFKINVFRITTSFDFRKIAHAYVIYYLKPLIGFGAAPYLNYCNFFSEICAYSH